MEITKVEARILYERFIIVRVETDEGIVGYGESSPMGASVVGAAVHRLGEIIRGRDPFQTEAIWMEMYKNAYKLGPGGAQLHAMAGIDIALHDIKGKALGTPVYNLLGGAHRRRIPVYASLKRRDLPPEGHADLVEEVIERGFTGYKQPTARPWMNDVGNDQTIEIVEAIRKRLGDRVTILVDVNNAYTVHHAIQVGRELERLGVFLFEEPISPNDYDGYRRLQAALDIPVAAGEQEYTRWQHRDLIQIAQVDILQPDVIKAGGFTEMMKIAALAQTHHRPIVTHNTQPTLGTAASLHFWAACPSCLYPQGLNIDPHPLRDEAPLLAKPLIATAGHLDVPDGPGLGVEVNDDYLLSQGVLAG